MPDPNALAIAATAAARAVELLDVLLDVAGDPAATVTDTHDSPCLSGPDAAALAAVRNRLARVEHGRPAPLPAQIAVTAAMARVPFSGSIPIPEPATLTMFGVAEWLGRLTDVVSDETRRVDSDRAELAALRRQQSAIRAFLGLDALTADVEPVREPRPISAGYVAEQQDGTWSVWAPRYGGTVETGPSGHVGPVLGPYVAGGIPTRDEAEQVLADTLALTGAHAAGDEHDRASCPWCLVERYAVAGSDD